MYLQIPPKEQGLFKQVWIQSFLKNAKEPSLHSYLPIAGEKVGGGVGFIPFPIILAL